MAVDGILGDVIGIGKALGIGKPPPLVNWVNTNTIYLENAFKSGGVNQVMKEMINGGVFVLDTDNDTIMTSTGEEAGLPAYVDTGMSLSNNFGINATDLYNFLLKNPDGRTPAAFVQQMRNYIAGKGSVSLGGSLSSALSNLTGNSNTVVNSSGQLQNSSSSFFSNPIFIYGIIAFIAILIFKSFKK